MRRIELDGRVVERGGQQFVSGRGTMADGWTEIHRIEPHGFASHPIKGGKALLLPMPRNPDMAFVLGGENPANRPSGLPAGATALYDAEGNIIKLMGPDVVMDFGSRTITMTGGTWNIKGDLNVDGNITATGSIIDTTGNTNHHSH
jgi:phage gp45-like